MTATAAARPASPEQRAYIVGLAARHDTPMAGATDREARLIARFEDALCGKDLSSREASEVIDWMKGLPARAVAQAPKTGALYEIPVARYCLRRTSDDAVFFFEVVERKGGRRYLNRLVGAPGDWRRGKVAKDQLEGIVAAIAKDPAGAAKSFAEQAGVCSKCLSPLSDETSRALGLGPHCRKAFGL